LNDENSMDDIDELELDPSIKKKIT
jgi:hypothetical protein